MKIVLFVELQRIYLNLCLFHCTLRLYNTTLITVMLYWILVTCHVLQSYWYTSEKQ